MSTSSPITSTPEPRGQAAPAGLPAAKPARPAAPPKPMQALVRAAHRTIGLAAPAPPPAKDKGKKRRRRPVVRALQAVAELRAGEEKVNPEAALVVPSQS